MFVGKLTVGKMFTAIMALGVFVDNVILDKKA